MPNKLDRFGINSSVLAEVATNFFCNFLLYFGTLGKELQNGRSLAEDVVLSLSPNLDKHDGYNIITDNFFFICFLLIC